MESLAAATVPIKPAKIRSYFDKVAVWLREPADKATLAELEDQCGHLNYKNLLARFDRDFRQRLEFKQPGPGALRWLAGRSDAYINQVEVALDYEFDSAAKRNRAYVSSTNIWCESGTVSGRISSCILIEPQRVTTQAVTPRTG